MESLSQEVSISEMSHWQLWNYSWHIHAYGIESWKSEPAKYLQKLPLAPCLTQGQFYLCHSWLMFIKPINNGVPWWQLQFSSAICSVPFYIFIIDIFMVSDPCSFVLEFNLITFLFYSSWSWQAIFFPFLFPYHKVCKYVLKTGEKFCSFFKKLHLDAKFKT